MKYKMLFPSLPNHVPQIPAGSHRLLQTIIYCIVSDFLVILSGNVWLMPATLSHLEVQDPTLNFSEPLLFFASSTFLDLSLTTFGFSSTPKNCRTHNHTSLELKENDYLT